MNEPMPEMLGGPEWTREQKAAWMKKYMPEALDMMREGKKNGLTFNEPQNLRLKVTPS